MTLLLEAVQQKKSTSIIRSKPKGYMRLHWSKKEKENLPISSGRSAGSVSQRSAWALRSIRVTAPGRGSLRCCLGRIPRRFHITSARLMISDGGMEEGLSMS